MLEALGSAIPLAFAWDNLLWIVIGVVVGVSFGAIPGLTGIVALALLLPFTFYMSPVGAMALLLGSYKGSMFGGSISAITFGVPGDSPAAADVLDGFTLTKNGKPRTALNTALYSSIAGNAVADLVVIFTFVPLGMLALAFGPRELFALMFLAMTALLVFVQGGVLKAIIGAMIGFFISTIGLDPILSRPRLDFGITQLESGISLVAFVVGLFALSELLMQFSKGFSNKKAGTDEEETLKLRNIIRQRSPDDYFPFKKWLRRTWRETLMGSGIGVALGALPGPGGTMAAFSSYAFASRMRKNLGKFGTGVPEGVAAPEAANSATVGPTLIPLLAFGIPGSPMAGIFMGAFMLQGIAPGPGLFTDYADVMVAVFIMMLAGTFVNLFVSKFAMIPIFSRLGLVDPRILVPALIPLLVIGIYSINLRPFDVVLMVGAGLLGFGLRRLNISLAPTVVAFMIGPMVEKHFRRGLILGAGDWTYWFASPIALGLYIAAIVLAVFLLRRKKGAPDGMGIPSGEGP
ncbi:tripartite tricarboxylate transporter permease [Chloroflexota bacterium]